jgi:hypothetical protein
MLSDHERRTLARIETHVAATDPGFAKTFAADDRESAAPRHRRSHILWMIAACAALLTLLALGVGLLSAVILCAAVALGGLVCHLNGTGYGYI